MPTTNYPNGVSSFGVPMPSGGLPMTAGKYLFVHSVTGSNGNSGDSSGQPLATIVKAITLCTAAKGDVIVCLPGHTEAVTGAGTIALSKSMVRLVGLGTGRSRPIITYTTAAGASVDISGAGVTVENVTFAAPALDTTAAVNITAADVSIIGCEFELGNASFQHTLGILTTSAADRLLVQDCWFHGSDDAGTVAAIRTVSGNDHRFLNNLVIGNFTTSLGFIDNTTVSRNVFVMGNTVFNRTASSTVAVTFAATSDGHVSRNNFQVLSGTAPIVGANMSWSGGNYYAATDATAGTLI